MAITNRIGKRSLNSVSGENATFSISQTDNTSGTSNAYTYINVAGTSAGDAYIVNSVSGVNDWATGIDTSDSSGYTISKSSTPGSTLCMRSSAAGIINWPLQCAFFGYKTSDSTNATGNGAAFTVTTLTESYDQNGDFDNTNGIFTAPVTGIYFLNGNVQFTVITAAMTQGYVQFKDVDTLAQYAITSVNVALIRTIGAAACFNVRFHGQLTAGTRVEMIVGIGNGAGNTATVSGGIVTYFQGGLLA